MAGRIRPASGTVTGLAEKRVSMVFQEDRLLPWRTALENVALVREGSEADARDLLSALGLASEADQLPAALSGGMQRRVAVARSLAADYELLLLDEPLTGLDGELRQRVLRRIQAGLDGRTAIWITHDPDTAAQLDAPVLRLDLLQD